MSAVGEFIALSAIAITASSPQAQKVMHEFGQAVADDLANICEKAADQVRNWYAQDSSSGADDTNSGDQKSGEANPSNGGEKQEGQGNSVPDKPGGKVTVPSDKWWKDQEIDPHEIKDGQGDSRRNLGVDKNGNIWSVDRRGSGNIRDYR